MSLRLRTLRRALLVAPLAAALAACAGGVPTAPTGEPRVFRLAVDSLALSGQPYAAFPVTLDSVTVRADSAR